MNSMHIEEMLSIVTAQQILALEGYLLDTRKWDDWLGLYTEHCEYWVPAWKSEHVPTDDPQTEASLIYYASRSGLEDRVWRVKSGTSPASSVLPRTQHQIANVMVHRTLHDPRSLHVRYTWNVHQYEHKQKQTHVFFGLGEATLVQVVGQWRISRKKLLLSNDYIPGKLDFFCL